jgi:hypothetical protein
MSRINPYIAIFKAKQGECNGVAKLSDAALKSFTPFFEIPNFQTKITTREDKNGKITKSKSFDEKFANACSNVVEVILPGQTAFLDLDFPDNRRLENGFHPLEVALNSLQQNYRVIVPVLNLDRDKTYLTIAVEQIRAQGGLFGLRLFPDDLQNPAQALVRARALVEQWKLDVKRATLLLDFRSTASWGEREMADVCLSVNSHPLVRAFGAVIYIGTSIPRSEDIGEGVMRRSRRELSVWQTLVEHSNLGFGDYGITYPDFVDIDRRGAAKIRYATEQDWIIVKGKLLSQADSLQYQRLAKKLASEVGYRPFDQSYGGKFIRRCLTDTQKLGGLKEWVAVDTNVHVELTSAIVRNVVTQKGRAPVLIES